MNIGIMTFHWVSNYGAVLQAYALQKHLTDRGNNVKIINYRPLYVIAKQRLEAVAHRDKAFFEKEKNLKQFRKKYLALSGKTLPLNSALRRSSFNLDCAIAGSDQIWNTSFTLRGEGRVTLSYFLNFLPDSVKRIGYAVSFGFSTPTEPYINAVRSEIKKFSAISVRETDGVQIVSAFNLHSEVVCDPTLLLNKSDYFTIAGNGKKTDGSVFAYILREGQTDAWKTAECAADYYGSQLVNKAFTGTMEDWLASILHSDIVVTNSFHGTMLSLILNRPFIALTMKGSGMNSRITSLLSAVGLSSRIVEEFSEEKVKGILAEEINWESVNQKLHQLRLTGENYLNRVLN